MNPLQAFGEELKQHRQTKQISLLQISAATRIHVKFLEAIEAGTLSVLPAPYIRAFIKEYAQTVELDPAEVLRKYDEVIQRSQPTPLPTPDSITHERRKPLFAVEQRNRFFKLVQRNLVQFLGIAAILIVVLVLYTSGSTESPSKMPVEVSFDRAVKESEAALVTNAVPQRSEAPLSHASSDSLTLEITTIDSLWIMVVIDGKHTVEYLFPPKYRRTLHARDQFAITMGNAGGATFRLNGKELGPLGKRGAVVRNAVLTAESVTNL
ncbi:MAG TPA: RodZ domain-containing protein [Bacteroidota bacterium]|nr:RodZ domain-containing protein [Bacteroidota bacterium]